MSGAEQLIQLLPQRREGDYRGLLFPVRGNVLLHPYHVVPAVKFVSALPEDVYKRQPLYLFFAVKQRKFWSLLLGIVSAVAALLLIATPFTQDFNYLWLEMCIRDRGEGRRNFDTIPVWRKPEAEECA